MSNSGKLRLITYLYPGIPLHLYQTYQWYLEESLGMKTTLQVESRGSGPLSDRPDPFTADEVDIAFMCSTSFLRLIEEKNKFVELLPAAPIHHHPKSELRPIYFSDVIISKHKADSYKDFSDLKGVSWAFNDEMSLSGNIAMLVELKQMGVNASFFGSLLHSGSHHNSIDMVLHGRADAAAIDSTTLQQFFLEHPEKENELAILCSWGPLPIQPIVINSRMSDELKHNLTTAFLNMNKLEKWNKELAKHKVWGFKPSDISLYDQEKAIKDIVKGLSLKTVYY